jgi:hypothetical protein
VGRRGVHLGFFRFQSVAPRVAPPRVEGLWLAKSLLYADVTEEGIDMAGLHIGTGTYGAIRLSDLRDMPVMTFIRTVKEYQKMMKDRVDAG